MASVVSPEPSPLDSSTSPMRMHRSITCCTCRSSGTCGPMGCRSSTVGGPGASSLRAGRRTADRNRRRKREAVTPGSVGDRSGVDSRVTLVRIIADERPGDLDVTDFRTGRTLMGLMLFVVLAAACAPAASRVAEPGAALREAAGRGDVTAVRTLLDQGAPVDARDDRGATALIRAAYGNHVDVAAVVVRAGAAVHLQDDSRQGAYLIATSEVGDDPRLLDLTLGAGADIDAKDSYDGTGLIRAAERANVVIVQRLLQAGVDRDHVNRLGYTALHEAVVFGEGGPADQATVSALVAGGVDLDLPDGNGDTALAHAERRGQREVASILRAAGAAG